MTVLLTVLAIGAVGWFAGGTLFNVRRGSAILRWLQQGLPLLGRRTTLRWLGSTAVELGIRDADAPFRSANVVVFLRPRDLPWMAPFSRRRDTLIVRGELRSAPGADLEVLDLSSWSGRDALHSVRSWASGGPRQDGLATYGSSDAALRRADEWLAIAARTGLPVQRLSVRRAAPHLQLHVAAPKGDVLAEGARARALFEAVRELAGRAH